MTERNYVVNRVLTAMARGYSNPDSSFIADEVLPRIDVGGRSFEYDSWNRDDPFTLPDTSVSRTGRVNEVTTSATRISGTVLDWGLDGMIPVEDIDEAADRRAKGHSTIDPEGQMVNLLTGYMKTTREKRVADKLMDINTYDADKRVTLAGGDKWSDYQNSTPIEDIKAAIDGTFTVRPNICYMGQEVFSTLSTHPHIVSAILGNSGERGIVTEEQFAKLFKLKGVYIGDAYHNVSRPGQDAEMRRLWGNGIGFAYRSSNPIIKGGPPTFGFTAEWRQFGGSAWLASEFFDRHVGLKGGKIIRVGESIHEHIVASDMAYFINAPI